MTRIWNYAMRSEVGLVRTGNEDAAYAGQRLIAVADGMGGHAAGEVASAATIAALTRLDHSVRPGWDAVEAMRRAVRSANATLRDIVAADSELHGMGTTVTAAMLDGSRLVLAHVGDSRAYLLRDGELRQLTTDHTYVQQLVDDGRIRRDEMSSHPQRNLITRSIDGREDLDIDVVLENVLDGDRYLICSDGVSGVITDDTMARTLGAGTPDDAVDSLMELALRAGGPDNITCIVADVADVEQPSGAAGELAGAADDEAAVGRSTVPPGAAAVSVDHTVAAPVAIPPTAPSADLGPAVGRDVAPYDDPHARSRAVRRRHSVLITLVVLVVLGVAAGVGWSVVRSQYYVGVVDERVAIFQGVRGSVLGLDLSSVESPTDIDVTTLPEFAQDEVRSGIHADGLSDALEIVERLRGSRSGISPLDPGTASPCPQIPVMSAPPATSSPPRPTAPAPAGSPVCSTGPIPLGSPATASPASTP
ncbi:MAG TPA: PP2C family serine/threonine-protein phosphatase [Mycobacteriales bacterium]|nr:PP2C family serine/threonine-protein phosphatase [Mycobacteriales bacterium]